MAVLAAINVFTGEVLTSGRLATYYVLFLHPEKRRVTLPGSPSIPRKNGWFTWIGMLLK